MKLYTENISLKGLLLVSFSMIAFLCHSKMMTPIIQTVPITPGGYGTTIQDYQYGSLPTGSGSFITGKVSNYVKVAINHNYATLVTNIYHYNVEVEVVYKDINLSTTTIKKVLFVEYDPASGVIYKDYSVYNFSGAHEVKVKVVSIKDANTGAIISFPEQNIIVSYGIIIERFWNFNYSTTVCPLHTVADLNSDGEQDELRVSWLPITGAEEYELEWTYVDDYTNGDVAATKSISAINYDFKYNSTRILTKNTDYKINLVYERGYIIYRVRAVGRKLSNINIVVNGEWSKPDFATNPSAGPCTSSFYYTLGHNNKLNWQYSGTYAEEGKKKEVVGYYDGSLRNRQTVTKVNTTDTAIVGESIYDFQGRKAIDVLPVPAQSPALTYYANFNLNTNTTPIKYSRNDFDKDIPQQACNVNAGPMSPTSGSSRYYSPNNTKSANHQTYLPNAHNYPFNQVEYTPDNTGRIRTMGGVGISHQLGTGKETKYYYGKPLQEELDRLFGSEVGYDRHYKKNVVIDPNGQVSISYLDQEGHVIATSLSGSNPENVSAIASAANAQATLNVDLFSKNLDGSSFLNARNINETTITFNTQYLVSTPSLDHTFDYNLVPETYTDECLPNICMDCIYDLEVQVRNECGVLIYTNTVRVGSLKLDNQCGGIVYYPEGKKPLPFIIPSMPVGNYQISKILRVNREAFEYYLSQYLDPTKNTCFDSYEDILELEIDKLKSVNCDDDCASCAESLGTPDDFVLTGKGTYEDWQAAYRECMEGCKEASICEQAYQTMLVDMMPGGQYAEWYDSMDVNGFNPDIFPLSILNPTNQLAPDGQDAAYWKNPKFLKKDGTTVAGYYEKDGITRSRIPVVSLGNGQYLPSVATTPFDINGISYIHPENLTNVRDIVTYWQESWARSLVIYHPEYCYYKWCALNTMDTASNITHGMAALSSEDFDGAILGTNQYATAVSKGWINPSDPLALLKEDPYFKYVPDGLVATQYAEMADQIATEYIGSGMTMQEMATTTIMCPGYFASLSSAPSSCTAFGGGTVAQNDAMWRQYRSFYYSIKQKFIKIAADNYAILTSGSNCGKGYNGCIGKKEFNPFASALYRHWDSDPYTMASFKPCTRNTFMLYKDKTIRFGLGEDVITGDEDKAGFNLYYRTGLCPAAHDLSVWLHQAAITGNLLTTAPLYTHSGLTKLLFNQIETYTGINDLVNYSWTPTIDGMDPTKLEIAFENLGGNILPCKIKLKLPASELYYTWDMVKDFTNIKVDQYNPYSGTQGFVINVLLDDDYNPLTPQYFGKGGRYQLYKTG